VAELTLLSPGHFFLYTAESTRQRKEERQKLEEVMREHYRNAKEICNALLEYA